MNTQQWNEYFYSHYHPKGKEWGTHDLLKYRIWYTSWLKFIQKSYSLSFSGKSAIELGCGIGSFSSLLKDQDCDVLGTDIASVMVDHAAKNSPNIPFQVYDVMKPFSSKQQFDFVFAFEVLEHIPNIDLAVKHIQSLLKSGGLFIGSTPYPYSKNMIDPTHINVHLPTFWKTLFEEHIFVEVQTQPMSFLPFFWKPPILWNPVIKNYIQYPGFVSTTLIVARK